MQSLVNDIKPFFVVLLGSMGMLSINFTHLNLFTQWIIQTLVGVLTIWYLIKKIRSLKH